MIDILNEQVLSLTEAAKLIPRRRAGKKCSVSCLYRWTVSGCKGVILESLQCGGTRVTSREALSRMFAALSAASGTRISAAKSKPGEREKAIAEAEFKCEQLGL